MGNIISMFERISRSFALVKASWGILMQDKKLLVFPVLSGIFTLLVIISFVLPFVLTRQAAQVNTTTPGSVLVLFLFYVASYFVVIFFNTALISCVHARLNGQTMTVTEGLATAARHIVPILAWAIIAATVGLILRMIQERTGTLGRIAAGIAGGVWSLVTMFVVPVMIFEEKGVFDSMKESLTLFKKTWGESVAGTISIGVVFGAAGMAGFLLVVAAFFTGNLAAVLIAIALFIVLIAALAIVSSAMNGIFIVALYTYAKTGTVPAPYPGDLIRNAFVPKQLS
jgi:hypothetical protein